MTTTRIENNYPDAWTGYVILWGQPVPESPSVVFHKDAHYNVGPASRAEFPDGTIMQLKKDPIGIFVLVSAKVVPENYEWTYIVGTPEYEFKLDQATGETRQVLKSYPLLSIGFKKAEAVDGLRSAPHSAVRRPKRDSGTAHDEPVPGSDS